MLTDQEVFDVAEPFGAFEYGDSQGDKRKAFAFAVIEANNAKVLADLKPYARLHDDGFYTFNRSTTFAQNLAGFKQDVYSADTVSALIQERDALAARVKELEEMLTQMIACHGEDTCPAVEMAKALLKATP